MSDGFPFRLFRTNGLNLLRSTWGRSVDCVWFALNAEGLISHLRYVWKSGLDSIPRSSVQADDCCRRAGRSAVLPCRVSAATNPSRRQPGHSQPPWAASSCGLCSETFGRIESSMAEQPGHCLMCAAIRRVRSSSRAPETNLVESSLTREHEIPAITGSCTGSGERIH